jgi:DNA-binding beta-propeller fold protein YncE
MVVDIDNDKLVGEVMGMTHENSSKNNTGGTEMAGVHGVCVLPALNKGFVSSGKDDTVRVFDLKSLKEVGQVKTGSKPDAVIYDPASKTIFAFNNGGTTATVIDPANDKTRTIELSGAPESGVPDGKGKMYVNLEDKSEIAVIDTEKMTVTNHWPLAPGTEPTGLAIDVKHHRLFSACKNKTMCVLDADTGKLITSLPIGDGVDFAVFDPQNQDAISSNGDGTLTVIHESTPDSFAVVQNVETQKGARTMAMDPKTHRIWLATAKMSDPPAGDSGEKHKRRVMEPGSFVLVVVGQE